MMALNIVQPKLPEITAPVKPPKNNPKMEYTQSKLLLFSSLIILICLCAKDIDLFYKTQCQPTVNCNYNRIISQN